ncbi:NB-ARC domain-containing protein [Calothrix sp. PCC 7507]|uniref:WD40 domain-containing protein n=1 Tax=Calothrix sp. PCC 7507 TaxID=99598 RepID=UPI00029F27C7|nr:NB-ARC domain-containing protein [Calothrix sp. PCC 7507]AFY31168.1 WD-40 repeat-containing protein [Calothrix sp. PCC 7507]
MIHECPRADDLAQKFAEVNEHWNLKKLYQDIVNAKQQERRRQCKQLTPTEKACLRGLLCNYSPTEIATALNREPNGLRVELSRGLYRYIESLTGLDIKSWSNVSKQLENAGYKLQNENQEAVNRTSTITNGAGNTPKAQPQIQNQIDWGEAIDVSIFYDRTDELTKLQRWVEEDKCRLIALLGMGGIGKTALSVKLAQLAQEEFEFVIWRSLRDSPCINELLNTLIKVLSCQQETNFPETVSSKISLLIEYLRNSRSLLVLDNFDALFSDSERAGSYRAGYEEYGELLQRLGEVSHQSCVLLTSREKPAEIAALAGEFLPVRSLQLSGLKNDAAQDILAAKGLSGSVDELEKLIDCYRGNPLALKIAATSILDLFDGSIADFLKEGTTVFNGVRNLLERQFQRLSPLEAEVMYWTCINREPVQVKDLQDDIVPAISKVNLLESLESLAWRSLIEKGKDLEHKASTFTQQPVVMEYVTDRLVTGVSQEIITGEINLLNRYALIKATSKDYIRDSQIRVILQPILNQLKINLKFESAIEQRFQEIISQLRDSFATKPGYGGGNIINLLRQLKADFTGYDFSNLTIWQADLQGVNLHQVNLSHANINKSNFSQSLANILTIAFSPDGKLLASGDTNGDICLWNTEDFQMRNVASLKGHIGWVWEMKFSADGKTVVSCSEDGTIRIWNISTGKCLQVIKAHTTGCGTISLSPNGQILASGGADATIKLWHVSNGKCLKIFKGHTQLLRRVNFSPDGEILASGSCDRTIKLWDVASGKCLYTLQGHTSEVLALAFSPDGLTLASGSADKTVKFWDINTGLCWRTLQGKQLESVVTVAFSPDGKTLAAAGEASAISLWDVETGQCYQTFGGYTRRIWSVAFNPQGNILASAGRNQSIKLWQIATGKCLKTLQGYTGRVWTVAFSSDGESLASGTDQTVQLWDVINRKCLKNLSGHTCEVSTLAFIEQKQTLVSGSYDRTIRVWDINTGQCLRTLRGHKGFIFSLTCNPDGQIIVSGSADNTIKLWDVKTGQCLNTLDGHQDWVFSVAWSPNGEFLASSCSDGNIKLWDTKTWTCLKTLEGHQGWAFSIAFSPDSQILVSGGADLTVKLWNVKTGHCQQTFSRHTKMVTGVRFSPDGDLVASCSYDRTIKIWQRKTGRCLKTLSGHKHWILGIAFHPHRGMLASACQDQTIRLWDVDTGKCREILRSPRPYEGINITGIMGLNTAQKATFANLGAVDYASWR